MNFDSRMTQDKEDHTCEEEPDCKFRILDDGGKKNKGKPTKPPKKKKAKKDAQPPKRTGGSLPHNARSSLCVPSSPQESSGKGELMEEDSKCDEERTLLVRVRPGKDQAEVKFLNNTKGDVWEGPFGLDIPIQSLLDFDQ